MPINLYKNVGETPLECLNRFRENNPEYKDSKLSYAGRLDPMAEGKLLVLVNEENNERDNYLGLDKMYEVKILLGVSTDSFDLLGLIKNIGSKNFTVGKKVLKKVLNEFERKRK